jgi:hypothetical protein
MKENGRVYFETVPEFASGTEEIHENLRIGGILP